MYIPKGMLKLNFYYRQKMDEHEVKGVKWCWYPEPSALKVQLWRMGIDQIPAKLIQACSETRSEIHELYLD
jgi:hypothetical protein